MRLLRWKRFIWDLNQLPQYEHTLPSYFTVRPATRDEEKTVLHMIVTAFGLDTAWGDSFKSISSFIESEVSKAFSSKTVPGVVITHGARIIAASALNLNDDATSHLISGPCVLAEYRSRGLGTALLHESLLQLKASGLSRAWGVTKDNVTAGRFVYPKFGSRAEEYDANELLA